MTQVEYVSNSIFFLFCTSLCTHHKLFLFIWFGNPLRSASNIVCRHSICGSFWLTSIFHAVLPVFLKANKYMLRFKVKV